MARALGQGAAEGGAPAQAANDLNWLGSPSHGNDVPAERNPVDGNDRARAGAPYERLAVPKKWGGTPNGSPNAVWDIIGRRYYGGIRAKF